MNEILQNLINTGKVASFIDNIIIGTEGHDGLVEEVVKRLAENDLYVKLEKYKQKVREVEFLEVVIKPEGIKMEEKKVKGIEGERYSELADTKLCQEYAEVFRIGKLLSSIHQRLCIYSQTMI